jgi:hypothetical protein
LKNERTSVPVEERGVHLAGRATSRECLAMVGVAVVGVLITPQSTRLVREQVEPFGEVTTCAADRR